MDVRLVIFDCDGVLVDSEGPSNRVVAAEISKLGWPMTEAEATALFVGYRLSDVPPVVEARLGRPVPDGWVELLRAGLIRAFEGELYLMPGAREAVEAVAAMGLPFRIASNSQHEEMRVKFERTGLAALIGDRKHSARDVARGKPHPDVFLHAAAAEGVSPSSCVVVEDSIPGVTAAVAAGMHVFGLDPHGDGVALRNAGAVPFRSMHDFPGLLRGLRRRAA